MYELIVYTYMYATYIIIQIDKDIKALSIHSDTVTTRANHNKPKTQNGRIINTTSQPQKKKKIR